MILAFDRTENRTGGWSDLLESYTRPAGDYDDQPQFGISDFDSRSADYYTTVERSFGVVDRFGPADGSWLVVGGVRRQEIDSDDYGAKETTATLGALARITDSISVYGNYGQGLEPGQVVPLYFNEADRIVYENAGDVLSPYVSESYEVGVKMERGSLGATAALFQITRPSVVNQEINATTYRLVADGEQRNRGIEFNVFGEPVDGLRLVAGLAFLDPVLTGTEGGANDGNVAVGTPKRGASLHAEWDVRRVEGLTLSSGLTYRSRQFADPENTTWIDDYTTVDVGIGYEPPRLPGARASVDVINVFDNKYWSTTGWGTTSWGEAPRVIKASLSMDF